MLLNVVRRNQAGEATELTRARGIAVEVEVRGKPGRSSRASWAFIIRTLNFSLNEMELQRV